MNLPDIRIDQWDNAHNPSGVRNTELSASGWIKRLDVSSSGTLDFGSINITTSGGFAGTKLIVARPTTMGDATTIEDLRLYIVSKTAWTTGTYNFKFKKLIHFQSGLQLISTDDNVPITLPASQNILNTHSGNYIQVVAESGCTQYIYLDVYADTDTAIGQKGGPAANSFRYRLRYTFY